MKQVLLRVKDSHQVMVFVHSRKDTVKTAYMLRDEAIQEGKMGEYVSDFTKSSILCLTRYNYN